MPEVPVGTPGQVPFDPREAFAAAVRAHDKSAVRQLIATHADDIRTFINDALPRAPFGATPLLCALRKPDFDMVDILLGAGADINVKSHWWAGGFSVLDSADPTFAQKLIDRGATLEAPSASKLGRFDELKRLIEEDPSRVHARGGDGQTPLHVAATLAIAEYLVAHGAEIDARDVDHESTPAQYLVRDKPEIARFLISRGCWTDILMAAALGHRGLVEKHLAADPANIWTCVNEEYFPKRNPRAGGTIYIWTLGYHKTAHLLAREFRHEDIFQLLMDRSPNDLQLAMACELGDEPLIVQVTARDPNVAQALSEHARRRLPRAAMNDKTRAVRALLAAGWPVDTRDIGGTTALHWAGFHGNLAMTRDLLARQAPLEVADDEFKATPLGWAMHGSKHGWHHEGGQYDEVIDALKQAGAHSRP
jgi:ankyrin repeat protein